MPCLFAIIGGFAPRIALLLLWLFTNMVTSVFNSWTLSWLWPLLGIIFLPYTTLFYVLVAYPLGNANIWGWLCVLLGFVIDLRSYGDAYEGRGRWMPRMGGSAPSAT